MENQVVQLTIVAVIILIVLLWVIIKMTRFSKGKDKENCACCSFSSDCKAKELVELSKKNAKRNSGKSSLARNKTGFFQGG
ncbi:MAG: hypothetical protein J1E97_02805 [Muribaculaceae bacterium]|nr:hypothetical protein [Muribaculaceae bacterium]